MKNKPGAIIHLLILILLSGGSWLWTFFAPTARFSFQLLAGLALLYLWRHRRQRFVFLDFSDSCFLTALSLLLIFSSGGLSSPFFFLLYFLLFGLTLSEPWWLTFSFSAFLAFFFLAISPLASWQAWLNPLSLFLVAPLSIFFGWQYFDDYRQRRRLKLYQRKWLKDEEHLGKQETAVLLWLTTHLHPALTELLDKVSLLLADLAHLNQEQKTSLKRMHRLLLDLWRTSQRLEQQVDKETDND